GLVSYLCAACDVTLTFTGGCEVCAPIDGCCARADDPITIATAAMKADKPRLIAVRDPASRTAECNLFIWSGRRRPPPPSGHRAQPLRKSLSISDADTRP